MGRLYVIATGNAFDGTRLYGPFEGSALAGEWAAKCGDQWEAVEIESPTRRYAEPTASVLESQSTDKEGGTPRPLPTFNTLGNYAQELANRLRGLTEGRCSMAAVESAVDELVAGLATVNLHGGVPTYTQLVLRLRGLADGARSKAGVLASGSPTAKHYDPVQILKALADEAERGLGGS